MSRECFAIPEEDVLWEEDLLSLTEPANGFTPDCNENCVTNGIEAGKSTGEGRKTAELSPNAGGATEKSPGTESCEGG